MLIEGRRTQAEEVEDAKEAMEAKEVECRSTQLPSRGSLEFWGTPVWKRTRQGAITTGFI